VLGLGAVGQDARVQSSAGSSRGRRHLGKASDVGTSRCAVPGSIKTAAVPPDPQFDACAASPVARLTNACPRRSVAISLSSSVPRRTRLSASRHAASPYHHQRIQLASISLMRSCSVASCRRARSERDVGRDRTVVEASVRCVRAPVHCRPIPAPGLRVQPLKPVAGSDAVLSPSGIGEVEGFRDDRAEAGHATRSISGCASDRELFGESSRSKEGAKPPNSSRTRAASRCQSRKATSRPRSVGPRDPRDFQAAAPSLRGWCRPDQYAESNVVPSTAP